MLESIAASRDLSSARPRAPLDADLLPVGLAALWFEAPHVHRAPLDELSSPRLEWGDPYPFRSFGMALKYISAHDLGARAPWSAQSALRALRAMAPGSERSRARLIPWSGRLVLCVEAPFHPSVELTEGLVCDAPDFAPGRQAFARAVGALRPGAYVPIDQDPDFYRRHVRPFLGGYQAGAMLGERELDWGSLLASPSLGARLRARSEAAELAAVACGPRARSGLVRL